MWLLVVRGLLPVALCVYLFAFLLVFFQHERQLSDHGRKLEDKEQTQREIEILTEEEPQRFEPVLQKERKEKQRNEVQNVILLVPHKTASTFAEELLRTLETFGEAQGGLPTHKQPHYNDVVQSTKLEDLQDSWGITGSVREFTTEQITAVCQPPGSELQKSLFIMWARDPRDVLISQYFSYGFTHVAPPKHDPSFEPFEKQRKSIQAMSPGAYFVSQFQQAAGAMDTFEASDCGNIVRISYHALVSAPCQCIAWMLDLFGVVEQMGKEVWEHMQTYYLQHDTSLLKKHIMNPAGGWWRNIDAHYMRAAEAQNPARFKQVEAFGHALHNWAAPDPKFGVLASVRGWDAVYEELGCEVSTGQ